MEKRMMLDDRMASYKTFFDHGWATHIGELSDGTPLEAPVFGLSVAWKQAANTHCLPYVMMTMLKSYADGLGECLDYSRRKLLSAIVEKIATEVGDLRPMQRKRVTEAVRKIDADVRAVDGLGIDQLDAEAFFAQIALLSELRLSLSGSQRLCYSALYHAYEHFILCVYKLVTGQPKYRIPKGGFPKALKEAIGKPLSDFCYTDPAVNVARVARNALTHNGGQVTEDLARLPHTFQVVDDEIQVMPAHTSALFDLLKVRALKLTEWAITTLAPTS